MGTVPSCASSNCCSSSGSALGNKVFVSHCKRTDTSEDRAIWIADTLDSSGFKAWFDRSDLSEITMDKLQEAVEASHCLITVLDPFTFESPWVEKENEWARDAGIPILIIYDGDRYRWEQVAKWQIKYPHCFKYPALEYVKNYRTESRNKLVAAVHERICEAASAPKKPTTPAATHSAVVDSDADTTPSRGGSRKSSKNSTGTLKINTNADIRVAVGSSSNPKISKAVEAACMKLVQKLNGQPSFMICVVKTSMEPVTESQDVDIITNTVKKHFPDVPFIGGMSFGGILVDCTWVCPQNAAVALWGINDPAGVYQVTHEQYDSTGGFANPFAVLPGPVLPREAVEASAKIAFDAGAKASLRAMDQARAKANGEEVDSPQFVFMLPAPGHEQALIDGIGSVLGATTPVLGGSSAADVVIDPKAGTVAFTSKQFSSVDTGDISVCMALCWPSVHVAAAFCSGYIPKPNCGGTVTKVGHQYHLLEIDGKPARDVALDWAGSTVRDLFNKGHNMSLKPEDADFQSRAALDAMIAVEVGKDQDGEPVYRNNLVTNWIRPEEGEGLVMMTPIKEGDHVSAMWSTKENLQKRTSKVAKQLLRSSGFKLDEVRGALCIMCGENVMVGGPDSMQQLCEEVSSAVGFAPALGLTTCGEQGMVGDGTSCTGCLMYSSVIFTNKKVDNVMTPGRNYKSMANTCSMLLSEQGVVRETADDET